MANNVKLEPCPFCGEYLRVNRANLGVNSRESDCLLRQQVVVMDDPMQVQRWNMRAAQPVAAEGMPERRALPAFVGYDNSSYMERGKVEGWNACLDACAPAFAELAALRGEVERLHSSLKSQVDAYGIVCTDLGTARIERDTLRAERDAALAEVERLRYSHAETVKCGIIKVEECETLRSDKAMVVNALKDLLFAYKDPGNTGSTHDEKVLAAEAALANEAPNS